jgi:hypothetical protein
MSAPREDIEQAAERAVRATLLTIGIDIANPLQAQRDFAIMREIGRLAMDAEFRKDLEHTRRWRLAMEAAHSKGFLTIVGLVVTGTATALFVGLQAIFGRH